MSMTLHTQNSHISLTWYLSVIFLMYLLVQPVFAGQEDAATATQTLSSVATLAEPVETAPSVTAEATASTNTPATPYYSAANANNKVGSGSHLMSVTLALLFVVALIVAVSWFIRRFGQGVFANTPQMKIIATMPLGTRERIMLVDIGGQQLLLGVTASQINTLHVFNEPVDFGTQAAPVSDFSRKLMSVLQQKNNSSDTTANNPPGQN